MASAGDMRGRLSFQARAASDDGHGNSEGDWREEFVCAANVTALKGGEEVKAQRLAGIQPYVIRIRASSASSAVTTAWRCVDARDASRVFDIVSVAPDGRNQWIELLATTGGADA